MPSADKYDRLYTRVIGYFILSVSLSATAVEEVSSGTKILLFIPDGNKPPVAASQAGARSSPRGGKRGKKEEK